MAKLTKNPPFGEETPLAVSKWHILAFFCLSGFLIWLEPHYQEVIDYLSSKFEPKHLAGFAFVSRISLNRFRYIIIVNEIRETLAGVFPSKILAPYIGKGASLTGGLTIVNIIATSFSVYFSYPALKAMASSNDLIDLAHPAAAGLLAAVAIAAIMFILINLFSHHFSNIFFRVLPLNILLLLITGVLGAVVGYADYTRMVQGTAMLAEEKAGQKESTILGYDPTTLGMIDSYYQEIAEQKQLISWCSVKGKNGKAHGKGIIIKSEQPGQPRQVVCSHKGCTKLAFSRPSYNSTAAKAYKRINQVSAALQSLIDNHADLSKSYKDLKESENASKTKKQERLEKAGRIASTWLYVFMLFSSLAIQLITKQAAKRAIKDGHNPLAIFGDAAPIEPSQKEGEDLSEDERQSIFDRLKGMLAAQANPSPTPTAKAESEAESEPERKPIGYQNLTGESLYKSNQIGYQKAGGKTVQNSRKFNQSSLNNLSAPKFDKITAKNNTGKKYKTKEASRVKKAVTRLENKGEKVTISAVAAAAKVSRNTAKKYMKD